MGSLVIGSPEAIAHNTGVSAFAAALAICACWGISLFHVEVPTTVAMALSVVLSGLISFALRYLPQPAQVPQAGK